MLLLRTTLGLLLSVAAVAQQYVISTVAGGGSTPATPGNMAGAWQFSARSGVFALTFSVTGQINQTGTSVSGQLTITGTPCATTATFTGTVSSTGALTMNLNENGQVVVFSGILATDGNSASGTYSAAAGGCTNGDKGTWSGQRSPTTNGGNGDGGLATNAKLDAPYGVAASPTGDFYIAEVGSNETDPRIRKVSSGGTISTVAGNGVNGYGGDGGPAANALLNAPFGLWVDGNGNVFIGDTGNERVRRISTNGIITTVAGIGSGSPGQSYPISGVQATNALLYTPWALTTDSAGNLYIAQGGLDIVSKVSSSTGIITTIAGAATRGYSGDNGSAVKAQLAAPSGVAVDASGNVYIADTNNARIRKVSASGIITTIAGNGVQGYAGDGGQATTAELNYPCGIALDGAGNLYIADLANNRIRKVAPNGVIITIAGNGMQGYSGDGGPAASAELNRPNSVAVDSSGNIIVADTQNNAIRSIQGVGSGPSIAAVTNAASNLADGFIAPGEIVVLYGTGLGQAQLAVATVGADGLYDTQLAGTTVLMNGIPAPVIYTSATQVSVIAPYGITGSLAQLTATFQNRTTPPFSIPVAASAPSIFTSDSTGKGQAAAINQDGITLNSASAPARRGDIISLYATGEGQTTPAGVDGKPASLPLPHPNLAVTVTIGGQNAQVQYAGGAPGEVAGLMQINVQIPPGIAQGNGVPVVLQVGNARSQSGVTIAVQ